MEDEEWEDVIVVSFVPTVGKLCYASEESDPGVSIVETLKHPTLTTVIVSRPEQLANSDLQQSFTKSESSIYKFLTRAEPQTKLGFLMRVVFKNVPRAAFLGRTANNEVHILDSRMETLSSIPASTHEITATIQWKNHIYCFAYSKVCRICPSTSTIVEKELTDPGTSSSSVTSTVYATPKGLFFVSNYKHARKLDEDFQLTELASLELLNGFYVDSKKPTTWIALQARGQLTANGELKTTIPPHDPEHGFFYSVNKAFSPYIILGEHQDISQLNVLHAVRTSDLSRTSLLVLPEESSGVAIRSLVFFSPARQLQYLFCNGQGRGHLVYLNRGVLGLVAMVPLQSAPFRFCSSLLPGIVYACDSPESFVLLKLV